MLYSAEKIRKVVMIMKPRKTIVYLSLCIAACAISVGAMFDSEGKDVTVKYVDRFSGLETSKAYKTEHDTIGEFFSHNKILIGNFDKLSHDTDNAIIDGSEITITKAVPISISYEGKVLTTVTSMPTVSEALLETGMMPGENDIVSPECSTKVTEGMSISITSVTNDEVIEFEYIDFDTKKIDDKTLEKGKTKVTQEGKKGKIQVSYEITYKNDKQESKKEISRKTISEPVDKIIAVGTKEAAKATASPKATSTPQKTVTPKKSEAAKPAQASENNTINGLSYSKKMTMTATAYSAFNSKGGYAKTATGMTAKKGVVAVDKSVIPLGTRLYIEGYGEAIAADVGGAVKGNIIDLCFEDTNANLRKFGRQKVQVYILN